ncbi:Glutathione peroxidase, house-cleaning role in reducing lipid peroxides [Pseudonocardia thermophila]|jgi:Glutathione peroxidase|uniref:Glutathione peroxidase n=1 Tax=Pseudonocardia thermophila TaxID=1848 RepID=A0A1M6UZ05_PSETH|nr:Glutathione peroxidase, house-cleaning role in reducing lipid peroxides [Pseudonocardia thermophila]
MCGVSADTSVFDVDLVALDGSPLDPATLRDKVVLVVNVASKCGLTPQYEGLEELQKRYGDRGFTVLGAPCNQFAGQEPGTPEEIATFCSATYGVTFPLLERLDVNGQSRHPLFTRLTAHPDAEGRAGDVEWNFEKFLVSRSGQVIGRFRPRTAPTDEAVTSAIEAALDASTPSGEQGWEKGVAADVRPGDRVRVPARDVELQVTRIDPAFFGNDAMVALIEDTPSRWLKVPAQVDTEVEIQRAS